MKQLFGTDGIRGTAGQFPLDGRTLRIIGASLAGQYAATLGRPPRFISGRDTRQSGDWIELAIHAGAVSAGAICESAGVITTPGVAYLTREFGFDAGVVISASHNPYEDNGIKIFSPSGKKIDEATERQIETDIHAGVERTVGHDTRLASPRRDEFRDAYIEHLRGEANGFSMNGAKVVVDCANGAACDLAASLFETLDADLVIINDRPDGTNINRDCGSLHIEGLQRTVIENGADIGIALDGDADRALFVDENGELVDGDATLWIMARYLKDHGRLKNSTVVATVMSNIGLELALRNEEIRLLRTNVGDKYVLEKLLETGAAIGGEQSGHIIFPEISLVGDGLMTSLLVLRAITERGLTLSDAAGGFVRYPQILLNVRVRDKLPFDEVPAIAAAARDLETELDGSGRLLLRYSGTENLARVMIEGKDQAEINEQAGRLAEVIRVNLG